MTETLRIPRTGPVLGRVGESVKRVDGTPKTTGEF